MRLCFAGLLVTLLGPLSALSAQEPPPLERGARIRLGAPDCGFDNRTTRLEDLRGDTLVFTRDLSRSSNPNECPLASVTRLEVRTERSVSAGRAVGYSVAGLFIGAAVGGAVGYATCAPCNYELEVLAPLGGAAIGGGAALLTGLIIGLMPRDRWEYVPLDRVRLGLTSHRDGRLALGMSISF